VAELDRRMNAASEEDFIPWEQVRAESERLP